MAPRLQGFVSILNDLLGSDTLDRKHDEHHFVRGLHNYVHCP